VIELANDTLRVQVLHPVADRERLGSRYCTGGYVFQLADHERGDLLSGPTFPDSFNWYDGQGLPDSFAWSPLPPAAQPASAVPAAEALVPGVGVCDLAGRRVLAFCDWHIEQGTHVVTFRTRHLFGAHDLSVERTLALVRRTLCSRTRLDNHGASFVPVRWFPHPFFPHPADAALLAPGVPVQFAAGAGYQLDADGFIARAQWPWQEGRYLPLQHGATAPPTLLVRHPRVGLAAMRLSYVPGYFALWGNASTFSPEPFLERTLAPGQSLDWSVDYTF
jgi:hypothetical protein